VPALVVGLGAAVCYSGAAVLQHRAARQEATFTTLDPRLLVRLARRRLWVLGVVADLLGAGLHAWALAIGPLALVQPLLVGGLILAVPLDAAVERRRPSRRDLRGVLLAGSGLVVFVALADPRPGLADPPDAALLAVCVGLGTTIAGLVTLAVTRLRVIRATLLGIATGAGYSLAATLAKAVIGTLGNDGVRVLQDWRLYAMAAVGLIAVVLNQNAFQAGTLAGPLTGIVLTDPLVSLIIGVTAYQEHLELGPTRIAVELVALVTMVWGVWLVSVSWSAKASLVLVRDGPEPPDRRPPHRRQPSRRRPRRAADRREGADQPH
jgi:hypothetical protein